MKVCSSSVLLILVIILAMPASGSSNKPAEKNEVTDGQSPLLREQSEADGQAPLLFEKEPDPDVTPIVKVSVALSPRSDWEAGVVSSPCIWEQNGRYRMIYLGDPSLEKIGFAASRDGKTWARDQPMAITIPAGAATVTNFVSVPGRNMLLAQANTSAGNMFGICAYSINDRILKPLGIVSRPSDIRPQVHHNSPGCVVEEDGMLFLYSSSLTEGNRNAIYRLESEDGLRWTNPKLVLAPGSSGFDAGHVTLPFVVHDKESGEWTMWYIANSHVSGASEGVLCRARSRDGLTWSARELFIRPEWISPDLIYISYPCQFNSRSGDYLYVTGHLSNGGKKIFRIEIPSPHRAWSPDNSQWTFQTHEIPFSQEAYSMNVPDVDRIRHDTLRRSE